MGQLQRRGPGAVGQLQLGFGVYQRFQGGLVALAAIPQHNGFNQRGPVQVVDVVQRRTGGNQLPHHAVVAQMGGRDQRRAIVATGHQFCAGTQLQQHTQGFLVVGHGGNGDGVVTVVFQGSQGRAALGQGTQGLALARKRRHVQGRAAMGIARVRVGPGGQLPLQLGQIALLRRLVQALVTGNFGGTGRNLCLYPKAGRTGSR